MLMFDSNVRICFNLYVLSKPIQLVFITCQLSIWASLKICVKKWPVHSHFCEHIFFPSAEKRNSWEELLWVLWCLHFCVRGDKGPGTLIIHPTFQKYFTIFNVVSIIVQILICKWVHIRGRGTFPIRWRSQTTHGFYFSVRWQFVVGIRKKFVIGSQWLIFCSGWSQWVNKIPDVSMPSVITSAVICTAAPQ